MHTDNIFGIYIFSTLQLVTGLFLEYHCKKKENHHKDIIRKATSEMPHEEQFSSGLQEKGEIHSNGQVFFQLQISQLDVENIQLYSLIYTMNKDKLHNPKS